jgi:hypothetical protein
VLWASFISGWILEVLRLIISWSVLLGLFFLAEGDEGLRGAEVGLGHLVLPALVGDEDTLIVGDGGLVLVLAASMSPSMRRALAVATTPFLGLGDLLVELLRIVILLQLRGASWRCPAWLRACTGAALVFVAALKSSSALSKLFFLNCDLGLRPTGHRRSTHCP